MPQLNFTIPADLLDRIDAAKPNFLDRKGFLCLLLTHALDASEGSGYSLGKGGRGVGANEAKALNSLEPQTNSQQPGSESSNELSSPKNKAQRFVFSVPEDLAWCKPKLSEYWRDYKAGRKSKPAAATLISGVRKIAEKYGQQVVLDQLDLACAYNWENVTLANYERFGLPVRKGGGPAAVPEMKHPASREFRNGRFVDEDGPTTNAALAGLF
jgi:hypothetical protein